MNEPVRWGILGTGRIVDRLLRNIRQSEVAVAVAVAGRRSEKAAEIARKHGIPEVAADFDSLVSHPDIEVIYNATPNHWHYPWTLRALAAGKHVLCEKPIALDARQAEEMFAAAARHGRWLMEAFAFRCHPQTDTIRDLVQDGALGEPAVVRAAYSFRLTDPDNVRWNAAMGGGALYDIGCYCINMVRWVVGNEPKDVTAVRTLTAAGVDLATTAALHFPGGVLASVDCSFGAAFRVAVEVLGTEGRLEIFSPWKPAAVQPLRLWRDDRLEEIPVSDADAYQLQVDHFSRCVRGQAEPRVPAEDSIGNMRVIDRIRACVVRNET